MTKLTVTATITAKNGKTQQLKAELLQLVASTRAKDAGCITYDLHQDNEDPAQFLVYEIWESAALLQKHGESTHFQKLIGVKEELVELFMVNTMTQIA